MLSSHMLRFMEWGLSLRVFDADWPITGHEVNSQGYGVWYSAPPPYRRGFLASVSERGIIAQREMLRSSMVEAVSQIPWLLT